MKKKTHMPHNISKKILDRCAQNKPVVVVPRNGKPSRCFGLEQYQKMQKQPLKHKPWERRKSRGENAPDPLGAVPGGVRSALSRREIYD
jgi:hypothetical protein